MSDERTDPVPDEFETYEEAAEFWSTHDTTDYPECFETVKMVSNFRGRYLEIGIEGDVAEKLCSRAHEQSVTVHHLANDLLRNSLSG